MKTLSKYLLTLTILFSSYVFADEEKRIEPGCRKLTEEEKKEIEKLEKQDHKSTNKKQLPAVVDNQYPPIIFTHYIHNLIGISALGDFVIIEDGSQWTIKPGYAQEAFSWRENDPIIITLNDSFMSSFLYGFKYKMINAKTNSSVEIKLQLGPILNNPFTVQVAALNPLTYQVILTDNSLWQCDPSQYSIFNKWLPGDGIIIGTNVKGWFNSSYENLLININLLQEIRSTRVE